MSDGAIGIASMNWIPLWQNHWKTYVMEFIVVLSRYYHLLRLQDHDREGSTTLLQVVKPMIKMFTFFQRKNTRLKKAAEAAGKDANDPYIERANCLP